MDEPQPQSASQPQSQPPSRTRSRLTDANISHRPRAVAGQRAAAKRAGQAGQAAQRPQPQPQEPTQTLSAPSVDVVERVEPVEPVEHVESAASVDAELDVETPESVAPPAPAKVVEPAKPAAPAKSVHSVRRAVITAVLVVALIAGLAIGAVLTVQYRDVIRTDHARSAAMAAAERAAPVIFSYDYRHLDQDFAKAETYLTGSFRDQYAKTTQAVVKPTALQYHGIVKAVVARPADGSAGAVSVISASPDQVVVLAFIDQSTTSTRVNGTQVDQNRVLLTLTHTAQGWRVSAVDAL